MKISRRPFFTTTHERGANHTVCEACLDSSGGGGNFMAALILIASLLCHKSHYFASSYRTAPGL
jgi:hypothetical protein